MDIEVSQAMAKTAKRYKLEPAQLAFADLIAVGWDAEDAWNAAIRQGLTWTKTARKEAVSLLANNEQVIKRIDEIRGEISKKQVEEVKQKIVEDASGLYARATSKKEKIIELQALLEKTTDTGDWLKINQQILDVTRMKQEETQKDDNRTFFYLPLHYPMSCQYCIHNPKKK